MSPTLTAPDGGGRRDKVPIVSGPITRRTGKGINTTVDDGALVAVPNLVYGIQDAGSEKDQNGLGVSEGVGYTVDGRSRHAVAFHENQRAEVLENELAPSLKAGGGKPGQGYSAVRQGMGVRRLTPRECERLQGFPDDWTAGQSDSIRYRQLGNAVAVPVVEYIARRIAAHG